MNYEVLISSSAQEDLDGIIKYISMTLAAPVAASNLYQKIQEAIVSLSDYPEAFALCLMNLGFCAMCVLCRLITTSCFIMLITKPVK